MKVAGSSGDKLTSNVLRTRHDDFEASRPEYVEYSRYKCMKLEGSGWVELSVATTYELRSL